MKKIYITRKIPEIAKIILEKHFKVDENEGGPLSRDQLSQIVKEYDGVLSTTLDQLDRELLASSTNLQAISTYAVGLDNIDVSFAKSKGIGVYNLPGVVTNSTADLAMALLLTYERKLCQASQFVKVGKWKRWEPRNFVGHEMFGKTMGILGFGRIGRAVAKRALPFGMKVIYNSRTEKPLDEELKGAVHRVSTDDLFEKSDYLCLLVPLTEGTEGMIDKRAFSKMKKDALLINMARGAVVVTNDLLQALKKEEIRGAVLDVTDPEPLPENHPLLECENCFIVPHIGTSTVECRHTMAKMAAEHLVEHFSNN